MSESTQSTRKPTMSDRQHVAGMTMNVRPITNPDSTVMCDYCEQAGNVKSADYEVAVHWHGHSMRNMETGYCAQHMTSLMDNYRDHVSDEKYIRNIRQS